MRLPTVLEGRRRPGPKGSPPGTGPPTGWSTTLVPWRRPSPRTTARSGATWTSTSTWPTPRSSTTPATRASFSSTRSASPGGGSPTPIGPVVLEDRLVYRREVRLLEGFAVDFQTVALSPDGRRFKVRNRFTTESQGLCATVESVGLWFDLAERRPIVPPSDLQAAFLSLERADDFEDWA